MAIVNFSKSACVRLDVSIWTARAKLRREDIPNADDLPPEALASMGSKRLFDPAKLRIFNTLKARAISLLDKKGVRFLGGWCVREDLLDDLDRGLSDVRYDFNNALNSFLQDYEYDVDQWLTQFPEWKHILQPVIPSAQELTRRFAFSWQMYRIEPVQTAQSNTTALIDGLSDRALEEVIRMAKETYDECFKNKTTVTKKAFRPVHTMLQKLDALTYLHPVLSGLHSLLHHALSVAELSPGDEVTVRNFQLFLLSLQAPAVIENVIGRYNDGLINAKSAFTELLSTVSAPAASAIPAPETQHPSQTGGAERDASEGASANAMALQVEECETPAADPVGAIFDMF